MDGNTSFAKIISTLKGFEIQFWESSVDYIAHIMSQSAKKAKRGPHWHAIALSALLVLKIIGSFCCIDKLKFLKLNQCYISCQWRWLLLCTVKNDIRSRIHRYLIGHATPLSITNVSLLKMNFCILKSLSLAFKFISDRHFVQAKIFSATWKETIYLSYYYLRRNGNVLDKQEKDNIFYNFQCCYPNYLSMQHLGLLYRWHKIKVF